MKNIKEGDIVYARQTITNCITYQKGYEALEVCPTQTGNIFVGKKHAAGSIKIKEDNGNICWYDIRFFKRRRYQK